MAHFSKKQQIDALFKSNQILADDLAAARGRNEALRQLLESKCMQISELEKILEYYDSIPEQYKPIKVRKTKEEKPCFGNIGNG